ncbi:helix-turn-helix transcriptional regulator [Pseudonocardia bannensis]|uniref:PadR family transcriptional regulator n=1 Tax=Pseudonocardia bannensis TaxID=630973 RepID=A0A848DJX9_9PSEU|nr:helix-turn-helix transcriptional regulator [Pseudonocardia bannensis]NMH92744.1 PadR family transcriptional regulator [Pseudonocardia bannensis]
MAELEPRNFLQPCLLLLLREQADHGYELAARLRPMHDGDGDAGGVYRALRGLERQGLVRSEWQTSDVGPARRTYHVTADGLACLDAQARGLEHIHEVLHVFLERYARVVAADRLLEHEGVTDDRRTDRGDGRGRVNGVRQAPCADRRAGH